MKLVVLLVSMVGASLGADWSCQQCRALSAALSQASSAQQDIQQQTQLLQVAQYAVFSRFCLHT